MIEAPAATKAMRHTASEATASEDTKAMSHKKSHKPKVKTKRFVTMYTRAPPAHTCRHYVRHGRTYCLHVRAVAIGRREHP